MFFKISTAILSHSVKIIAICRLRFVVLPLPKAPPMQAMGGRSPTGLRILGAILAQGDPDCHPLPGRPKYTAPFYSNAFGPRGKAIRPKIPYLPHIRFRAPFSLLDWPFPGLLAGNPRQA